jgi:hypothetical protein
MFSPPTSTTQDDEIRERREQVYEKYQGTNYPYSLAEDKSHRLRKVYKPRISYRDTNEALTTNQSINLETEQRSNSKVATPKKSELPNLRNNVFND